MRLRATNRFLRRLHKLTKEEQKAVLKAVGRMQRDLLHPSLRTGKLGGRNTIWYTRATRNLRITFELVGDTVILRNCGHHDETLVDP